ncbi:MAG: 16S rRNA (cytidine(1402)-2'-O)-methyltransferase [Christensenella sp.]
MEYGRLLIVATPIGNLADITLRAIDTLANVDVIAAEDTRHTVKLLNHYEIKNKLISFHEYSNEARFEDVLTYLRAGKDVALVSDAGTPVISDPGHELVRRCAAEGIAVESIPGACAAISAVAVSGMDCSHFVFWGFLNAKSTARKKELERIAETGLPCVIYESPNRILKTLGDVCSVCGEKTQVCICREITKLHEETLRTTARGAIDVFESREAIKGEFAVVLYPLDSVAAEMTEEDIIKELEKLIKGGSTKKTAAADVAIKYKLPKNAVYKSALKIDDN